MAHAIRRIAFHILAVAIAATAVAVHAQQAYPGKAVRIVVAAAPGGTSDILARTIGQELSKRWGQPVLVDNRPGADSNLGADLEWRRAEDARASTFCSRCSPNATTRWRRVDGIGTAAAFDQRIVQ